MPNYDMLQMLGLFVVVSPLAMTFVLGLASILDKPPPEETTSQLVYAAVSSGLVAAIAVLAIMLSQGKYYVEVPLGDWVAIPHLYHFSIKFVFDRLAVPFVILTFVLSGTIGAFASRYMHRERGFNRFFVLYAIFVLGMIVAALAGTIETLYAGWELVGLSSALLVAFFQERRAPAQNGLWIWGIYRISDAALLLAAVAMHHLIGEGDFDQLLGNGNWPFEHSPVKPYQAFIVGMLLLAAAAGKSGLVPFSGWLPRAMEGPTPSSAVFYGALSVHLGAFLLLRVSPLLEQSIWLSAAVLALGLTTAAFAYLTGTVQTDIKSALSFASLSQVGIIVAEIGLSAACIHLGETSAAAGQATHLARIGFGLQYVALIHLLGHACLRTLQFVRAPTVLQDYRMLENAIGQRLPRTGPPWNRLAARGYHSWLYRLAIERGYLDSFLKQFFVLPFVRVFRACDALERRWTDFLSGGASRESDQVKPHFGTIEEFS